MPDVFLRRQSDSELRFAHSILSGWIFAAIGCAGVYFGVWQTDSAMVKWLGIGMGGLFALMGVGGALWRYELTLDLMARSYRRRRGFWPTPRKLQGSLSELRGVLLTRSWRMGDNSQHPIWVVNLEFQGWDKPVSFYETTSERKGYRKLEELARRLQIPAIDRTGDRETTRSPYELDRSVVDRGRDPGKAEPIHTIEEPPPGSGIEWVKPEIGAPMIVLPALGFNVGSLVLIFFGLPFLSLGALALASAVGWTGIEVHGSLAAKWIVGSVFVLIGAAMLAGVVFGGIAREIIRDDGDAIRITLRAFGWHYRKRRLLTREIEEISVKPSGSSQSRASSGPVKTEVVLRTDDEVTRIGGDLQPDSQHWLSRTLLALARRSW